MDPIDQPPETTPRRSLPFQLTRDTIILIAALLFLAFAVLLAVLFPPANNELAQQATAEPTIVQATAQIVAPADEPSATPAEPTMSLPLPTEPPAYPAPQEVAPPTETPPPALPLPTAAIAGLIVTPTDALNMLPTPEPPPTLEPPTLQPPPTLEPPTPIVQAIPPTPDVPAAPSTPRPTALPPTATPIPIDVIRGTAYWTQAQSPIILRRDTQIVAGAAVIIEPGVEVRIPPGVALYVDGKLYSLGRADQPVRIIGAAPPRWEGIFGRAGSEIVLEHTELRGGGAGGTLLLSEGGNLTLRSSRIIDNGGHVRANGSRVEMRDSEIAANDMPYGAAVEIATDGGGTVTLTGNRIGVNRMASGAPNLLIDSRSPNDVLTLDIQRNLLIGQDGPNLTLTTNGPLQGNIACNGLARGSNGLSVISTLPQTPGLPALIIRNNAIEQHTPPIIPIYLERGIGRGATSDVAIDMRENWWGAAEGPYEPDRHADGRGEAPGDNVGFAPWLTSRPACAPAP